METGTEGETKKPNDAKTQRSPLQSEQLLKLKFALGKSNDTFYHNACGFPVYKIPLF